METQMPHEQLDRRESTEILIDALRQQTAAQRDGVAATKEQTKSIDLLIRTVEKHNEQEQANYIILKELHGLASKEAAAEAAKAEGRAAWINTLATAAKSAPAQVVFKAMALAFQVVLMAGAAWIAARLGAFGDVGKDLVHPQEERAPGGP